MRALTTVIVGGGAAGLSTAMHLGRLGAGERVTVLEAAYPAAGSSSLAVGDVSALYEERDEIAMRAAALEFFRDVATEVGLELIGALRVVDNEADLRRLEKAADAYCEWGIEAHVLEPEQLALTVPDMCTDDLVGGLTTDVAGHLDGALLCSAYLRRAIASGVQFRGQTSVVSAERGHDHRFRVLTTTGEYAADVIVNAAGPWSAAVGELLGTPTPIVNQRHQVCVAHLPQALSYQMPQFQDSFAYVDSGRGLYLRPESRAMLLTGFHYQYAADTLSADPDTFSRAVDRDYVDALAQVLLDRFPGLGEMGLSAGWTGLYPMTRDSRLMVGPFDQEPNVIAATGLGGAGIQLSFAAGQMAAEWVLEREPSGIENPRAYLPDRASVQPS